MKQAASKQFKISYENFGEIQIRKINLEKDIPVLHNWVNQEYAFFWGLQNSTLEQVTKEYEKLTRQEDYYVFVGIYKNEIAFFLEQYNPTKDSIAQYYKHKPSDSGVHIIVAPPKEPKINNFTWYMFRSIMDFVFSNQTIQRILIEPDIRNRKMFALCQRLGFTLGTIAELPHKTAQLAFLEKHSYQNTKPNLIKRNYMNTIDNVVSPQQSIHHIQKEVWQQTNIALVKKAICEFSHERLVVPEIIATLPNKRNKYKLIADISSIVYEFEAKPLTLNHLLIEEKSIKKFENNEQTEIDALLFIKEFKNSLGLGEDRLPLYLEELTSTLSSSAYKIVKENPLAEELAKADFQTIEQSMTEGHPGFIANNGRIGFDSTDYRTYAPETGNSFAILWLAGHKSKAVYAAIESLPYEKLVQQELDAQTINQFNSLLENKGLNPNDYLFIPVHPWQWFNKLAMVFAPEIAKEDLVCLGYGTDQYQAQQSIRTLFNTTNPKKFYTKSALSILNMGFMRGLPLYYLGTAPKMAVWLENLLYNDAFIRETGFKMLSEIGSVSYVNPYFEEFGHHNDYNKMLASLWRESPYSKIAENQKPITMAALLHIDQQGNALLPEFIKSSGLTTEVWLAKYLKAYLSPLLHCFYQYDLVFMPHGENIILVLENNTPVSALLKDITEEATILSEEVALPEDLKRMYATVPDDVKLLSIFTDIFDGFFRYLVAILEESMDFSEHQFWKLVAQNITEYQSAYPNLSTKFQKYDLFANHFKLSCLNRLQLNNHKQMVSLYDPVAALQFVGDLENPIAVFKPENQLLEV